ncbi:13176_t:CDS:2 [Cetraspora pellucida]|uniref:13176_t:CDS:1 n=1 Tax=Cetraspora pellucida TaxID=1433469 RepID=A0A9N9FCI2_9GLOM|nr:13176_t:CDS:2 [Cetraspora pellucida]
MDVQYCFESIDQERVLEISDYAIHKYVVCQNGSTIRSFYKSYDDSTEIADTLTVKTSRHPGEALKQKMIEQFLKILR